ncbi:MULTISPECIES: cation diffusion facilitator family transporter [Neisseria]|uniref:Cation diffusion facilitator transporter family protein n=1 Tax=Neisseria musculi TaxID=1815583 RepID=A0A7H1MBB2_9NEIS|nr:MULTISPECIES: cation diffusion facilitator family transporter [Neisseria]MBF0803401.1 cation transporter [Neisseria sp. 19428wB4_WF04]QNT58927.1 cation diffusion facilitator transporter family protein [Neisseria musculi]TFU43911.1 cation transporter [Neisseria sp. WF04]
MSDHHDHTHPHSHAANKQVLRVSLLLIGSFMLVEAAAGWLANSLALLSDAGHMFSDAAAIALSLAAFRFGERPADSKRSFGYQRFEIIAAAVNGITLLLIAAWIVIEAVLRLLSPNEISGASMLAVAALGLAVNVAVAWYMLKNSDTEGNINMRAAYLHVLGDLLGSIGAIIAGILVLSFGWIWADSVISMLIALLIGKSGWGVTRNSLHILMEGTPAGTDMNQVAADILNIEGIQGLHDIHAWTITSRQHALSCHIVIDGALKVAEAYRIARAVESAVQRHGIAHVTVQAEPPQHGHEEHGCSAAASGAQPCVHHHHHGHPH